MRQVPVTMLSPAILAVSFVLGLSPTAIQGESETDATAPTTAPAARAVDEPVNVAFRLRDGVQIRGELTAWSNEGFDGTFGRRRWKELRESDAWRLYRSLIDENDATNWVTLGRTMLELSLDQPRAASRADVAFRTAMRLDPDQTGAISAAREAVEHLRRQRRAAEAAAAEARLRTEHPEAQEWSARPWPPLDDTERADAIRAMGTLAGTILNRAGLALEARETRFFLLYSDLDADETARWARELDVLYTRLAEQFELDTTENLFWGKAVVFIFADRDRFQLIEADSFGQLVNARTIALCHPIEEQVFINAYRAPDTDAFATALMRETVHGFMHRLRTPRRLPAWANEGLGGHFAAVLLGGSAVERERRERALEFIRGGGNVNAVLDLSFQDGSWPGRNAVGDAVGCLLVELMIRDRPEGFRRWVLAVKADKPWEQALIEDFGASRAALLDVFTQYYRVND